MKGMTVQGFGREDMLKIKRAMDEQLQKHGIGLKKETQIKQNRKEEWEVDPGKLAIKTYISGGAFASVFKGVFEGQEVAVKVLEWGDENQMMTKDEVEILRADFALEAFIWHTLDHPNIVKFVGATTNVPEQLFKNYSNSQLKMPKKAACMILEYLHGGDLKSYLLKHRVQKLPFETVIQLALDLARGLNYLHSKKIIHRDVKPENIILDNNLTLKLTDFGTAVVESSNKNEIIGTAGTRSHMAPEVINNKPYNRKCDVYSFGICLWEIYCCDIPYRKASAAVMNENSRPKIPRWCPSSLRKLMKKCWHADPKKRPEMTEVVSILKDIDTSKGEGMRHLSQKLGCLFF